MLSFYLRLRLRFLPFVSSVATVAIASGTRRKSSIGGNSLAPNKHWQARAEPRIGGAPKVHARVKSIAHDLGFTISRETEIILQL